MSNDLSLSVVLGAALGSSFKGVFGQAGNSVGQLGQALKATHVQLNQVQAFQRTDAALDETRVKLGETQAKVMALRKAIAAGDASPKLAKQLETTEAKAVKLSATLGEQRIKLRQEGDALRKAGIDTRDLNTASERLTVTFNKQKAALAANYTQLEKRKRLGAEFRGQMLKFGGTLLAARQLGNWVSDGAKFDAKMQAIGNTAGLTSGQIASLKTSIFDASEQTGQSADRIQAGIGTLTASGLDIGRAQQAIVAIGRTATAESADVDDLANASFTLIDTLGIKPGAGLQDALDILTQSGKSGAVELKDMAQYLPSVGAQFAALNMKGRDSVATIGAALEIAKKGAGNPSEAANNMENFVKALFAPTTLQKAKQNFGLDLGKIIEDAQKTGGNPFEASIQAVMKATHGDAALLAQLFQDAQAQAFLRPMMQHWQEYEDVKQKALSAHGVVDADFVQMQAQNAQRIAKIGNAWDSFKDRVGTALGNTLLPALGGLEPVLNTLGRLAGKFPHLTAALVGAAGAAVTFKTAVIGLKVLGTFIPSMGTFGGLVRALVPGLGLARAGILGLGVAMRVVGTAILTTPIGWILAGVAAIAGVAYLIYKFWGPIKDFFKGVGAWIGDKMGAAASWVSDKFSAAADGVKGAWHATTGFIGGVWSGMKSTAGAAASWYVGTLTGAAHTAAFAWQHPVQFIQQGWQDVKAGAAQVGDWFKTNMPGTAAFVSKAWSIELKGIGAMWDWLKAKGAIVIGWITAKIEWVVQKWGALKNTLGVVWDKVKGAGVSIGDTVGTAWSGAGGLTPATAGGPAFKLPPMRHSTPVMVQGGDTHFTINAAPGSDGRDIAKQVQQALDERDRKQAARRRSKLGDVNYG